MRLRRHNDSESHRTGRVWGSEDTLTVSLTGQSEHEAMKTQWQSVSLTGQSEYEAQRLQWQWVSQDRVSMRLRRHINSESHRTEWVWGSEDTLTVSLSGQSEYEAQRTQWLLYFHYYFSCWTAQFCLSRVRGQQGNWKQTTNQTFFSWKQLQTVSPPRLGEPLLYPLH